MLKVIASQGSNRFIVMDCDDVAEALKDDRARGRVLDLDQRKFFRPRNVHSLLETNWRWDPATMSDEKLQELLSQVEDLVKPWDEMKITNYDFMRHTMGRRPADWIDAPDDNPTQKSK